MPNYIPPRCHVVNATWNEDDRWHVDTYISADEIENCFPYVDKVYTSRNRKARRATDNYNRVRRALDTQVWREFHRQIVIRKVCEELTDLYGEDWVQNHPIVFDNLVFVFYGTRTNDQVVPQFSQRVLVK